jgi:hypothetical protein
VKPVAKRIEDVNEYEEDDDNITAVFNTASS